MAKEADIQQLTTDKAKLIAAAVAFVMPFVLFYYFEDESFLYRLLGIVVGFLVAAGLFFTTVPGRAMSSFLVSARIELRKMVWPTKAETLQTTLIVFVVVMIVALFLWALDRLLSWFMQWLIG